MAIQRMDNVLIVVEDLEAARAFVAELGMELEGETTVEGPWADRVVGLDGVRADIAMMRTPDGHGRVELSKFHTPRAVRAGPENAPANALGMRRIMFLVDDLDDVVARLRRHGAELVGEIAQYQDIYRLCFLRGPEGIIIGLAEQLKSLSPEQKARLQDWLQESAEAYRALASNQPAAQPELSIQYADYAQWQDELQTSSFGEQGRACLDGSV